MADEKVVEEQAGAEAPAAEGEAQAEPEVDPIEALRAEVAELRSGIFELSGQIADLADFRQKVTEVVTQTVEGAAIEAVNERLRETWAPRFEEILNLVKGLKESSAKADAEIAEVRLHLPLLRRLAGLEEMVARAEKAAAVVRQELARLQQPATPSPGGDILG